MRTAIFMRHKETPEQERERLVLTDNTIADDLSELAKINIQTEQQALDIAETLCRYDVIFGVVPAPVRWYLLLIQDNGLSTPEIHEAWNINRAPEGERPRFEFSQWVKTMNWQKQNS